MSFLHFTAQADAVLVDVPPVFIIEPIMGEARARCGRVTQMEMPHYAASVIHQETAHHGISVAETFRKVVIRGKQKTRVFNAAAAQY